MADIIPFESGLEIGQGFDLSLHDPHVSAIQFSIMPSANPLAAGQTVYQEISYTRSTSDLAKFLSVSASASIKTATGGGSARAKFAKQIKINKFSVNLLVFISVENAQQILKLNDLRLTENGEAAYPDQNSFIKQYGDSFIYGQVTGGEYLAIIEISAESEEERKTISGKVDASGSTGVVRGSISAKMKNMLTDMSSEYSVNIKRMRIGGQGNLSEFTLDVDPETFLQEANTFPTAVLQFPVPISLITIPYQHLEHPDEVSPFDRIEQEFVLRKLEEYRQGLNDCLTQLDFALAHPDQFPGLDVPKTRQRKIEVSTMNDKVLQIARGCINNAAHCSIVDVNSELLNPDLPERKIGGNNMSNIQIGTVNGDRNHPNWNLDEEGGAEPRKSKYPVEFKSEFMAAPEVTTSLWHIDAGITPQPLLFAVFAEAITTKGFVLVFETWGQTQIPAASASWIAIGK